MPEIEEMLMTVEDQPFSVSVPFWRSGRKAVVVKKHCTTFVRYVLSHSSIEEEASSKRALRSSSGFSGSVF